MYLSTVEKGGETVFPNTEGWESQPKDDSYSECTQKGLAARRSGTARMQPMGKAMGGNQVAYHRCGPDAPDP